MQLLRKEGKNSRRGIVPIEEVLNLILLIVSLYVPHHVLFRLRSEVFANGRNAEVHPLQFVIAHNFDSYQ